MRVNKEILMTPDSIGLMTFQTREKIRNFRNRNGISKTSKVIKVSFDVDDIMNLVLIKTECGYNPLELLRDSN